MPMRQVVPRRKKRETASGEGLTVSCTLGLANEKTPGVENLRLVLDLGNFDQSRWAIGAPLRQLEHHRAEHEPARRASQDRSR